MKQNTKRMPIKGTSRRVVIVQGEEDSIFEQIVYFVRDDCLTGKGISAEMVLREAVDSLRSQTAADPERESSVLFSRILLILVLTALVLTTCILLYLRIYGWR